MIIIQKIKHKLQSNVNNVKRQECVDLVMVKKVIVEIYISVNFVIVKDAVNVIKLIVLVRNKVLDD